MNSMRDEPNAQAATAPLTTSYTASTYYQRNNWAKALAADRSQKMTARLIGSALGRRFKVGAGGVCACVVSYDDLADDAGCGRSTAIIGIAQLRKGGWLAPKTSNGRTANDFTLLMPSNGVNSHTVADVISDDNAAESEDSNGVTVHTPLKNNLQEVVSKKESKTEGRPAAPLVIESLSDSREPNGVTDNVEIVLVAKPADAAPMSPALAADQAATLDDPKPTRETADAARWLQQFMDDIRRQHNPVVKDLLNATCLQNEGRAAKPRARKIYESHYEAAYGPEP